MQMMQQFASPPSRGRELKYQVREHLRLWRKVAPFAGRELKLLAEHNLLCPNRRPLRGAGMKYNQIVHATLVQQVALFAEGET